MRCAERNNGVSYGRLLVAHGEHSPGPEISRGGETDKINHGNDAKVVEIEPVVCAAVEVETKPDAGEYAGRLTLADDALDRYGGSLGDF